MSEYEIGLRIQAAHHFLNEKADTTEGYIQWLETHCVVIEQDLLPEDRTEFLGIKKRNDSWRPIRKDLLEYLKNLLVTMEQHRLDRVYSVSDDKEDDKNLVNFADNWEQHRSKLLVFLGAGASIGARNSSGQPLPNAVELRDLIALELLGVKLPCQLSLEQASALAEEKAGRGNLCDHVEQLFVVSKPLWTHATLPFLKPRAVFTTNYDDLIERGWALHENNDHIDLCEPVYSLDHRVWREKVPIYKPHGSVGVGKEPIGKGGLVLTQFDYFKMIGNNMELVNSFLSDFENNCVLFIGYSLSDMDIGSQLWAKRKENDSINWYAVFPCDSQTQDMYRDQFSVRVINRKYHEFMKELDAKVDLLPEDWKFTQIRQLQDNGSIG
jgi:hypothetical protein